MSIVYTLKLFYGRKQCMYDKNHTIEKISNIEQIKLNHHLVTHGRRVMVNILLNFCYNQYA